MLFFVETNQLDSLVVWEAGIGAMSLLGVIFGVNLLYLVVTTLIAMCLQAKLRFARQQNIKKHRLGKFKRSVKSKQDEAKKKK
mmetsp:Transcript_10275/g.13919  ORF Transcript_10275/g.13919 Transcript_10275/m.13919 type:complete len:83 (+) Transcript_10275:199-447(+)